MNCPRDFERMAAPKQRREFQQFSWICPQVLKAPPLPNPPHHPDQIIPPTLVRRRVENHRHDQQGNRQNLDQNQCPFDQFAHLPAPQFYRYRDCNYERRSHHDRSPAPKAPTLLEHLDSVVQGSDLQFLRFLCQHVVPPHRARESPAPLVARPRSALIRPARDQSGRLFSLGWRAANNRHFTELTPNVRAQGFVGN